MKDNEVDYSDTNREHYPRLGGTKYLLAFSRSADEASEPLVVDGERGG